ncbi:MAG: MFS transporter [Actinomycetota bacterium]|nr:MFS transporter [Actinomycetota bacterium]
MPRSQRNSGRRARTAITVVFFVDGALMASWASRIPALAAQTHATTGLLGLVLLCPAAGSLLAMPVIGRWLSGRSSATFCRVALGALTASVMLPGLARSVGALAGALLLVGVSNSSLDVAMNAHGVTVERNVRHAILSSLHAAFSFGSFAGAGLGALAAGLSVSPTLNLIVAGTLFGGLGMVATRGLLARDMDPDAAAPRMRFTRLPLRLAVLGTACFASFLAEGGASDWSAKLVRDDLAGSAALGAVAYATFSVAMGAGRLFIDHLWARWGSVKLLRACGLLAALGFAGGLAVDDPAGAVGGFAALGLGLAGVAPTLFRAAADQPGVSTGPALSAVASLGYLGFLAGPPIVGGLASATSLRLACGLFVASGLAVAALAFAAADDRLPRAARRQPLADP